MAKKGNSHKDWHKHLENGRIFEIAEINARKSKVEELAKNKTKTENENKTKDKPNGLK